MPDEVSIAEDERITAIIAGAQRDREADRFTQDSYRQPPRSTVRRFDVLVGPIFQDCHLQANHPIRSVRVDNATNQWLQMGSELDFIPPLTFGRIFNVRGVGSVDIVRNVPPQSGFAQGAIAAGMFFIVTAYDKPQQVSYGMNAGSAGVAANLQ